MGSGDSNSCTRSMHVSYRACTAGSVEVWTHPPGLRREKVVLTTLKKGQAFGEQALLSDEPRSEVVTPIANCTFLTVSQPGQTRPSQDMPRYVYI